MPFDYAGGTQVPWRRLGPGDRSNVPHDTGGVAALCSLGCPVLFDCVDGAVSWFSLGSPLQFERSWCPFVVLFWVCSVEFYAW